METKKDNWIDQTLHSAEGRSPLGLSANLKMRLESIPKEVVILDTRVPMRSIWLAAASVALLITFNIATVKKVRTTEKQANTIYTEYFSYLDQI